MSAAIHTAEFPSRKTAAGVYANCHPVLPSVKNGLPDRFQQRAVKHTLIARQQRQAKGPGRGTDQSVGRILRIVVSERCGEGRDFGCDFMDDCTRCFQHIANATFYRPRGAQATLAE